MDQVRWSDRPKLDRPVLIAAFEGWNDAGDAASGAVRFLRDRWLAEPMATIDCQEYFDFSSTRPHVRIADDGRRVIEWPDAEFTWTRLPLIATDVVLLLGTEPQLRWRSFCDQVVEVAQAIGAGMVVTLGALLADVPHSRPVSVIGTGDDAKLNRRLDLRPSSYEGPTGIVGVLGSALRAADIPVVSLWAAVPSYVPGAPSPKATLALVQRTLAIVGASLPVIDLEIASASYERQINELVEGDEDTAEYVRHLEYQVDAGRELVDVDVDLEDDDEAPDADSFVEEVEQYLRTRADDE